MGEFTQIVVGALVGAVISGVSSAIYFGRRQCQIHCPYLTDKKLIESEIVRLRKQAHDIANRIQGEVFEQLGRHENEITKLGIIITAKRDGI